jgi:hypothetical protein
VFPGTKVPSPTIIEADYGRFMSIADFEQFLTTQPSAKQERSVLREGYTTLLQLGWPTSYIDWKMCERACEGQVPRYQGIGSWAEYKKRWANEDFRRKS